MANTAINNLILATTIARNDNIISSDNIIHKKRMAKDIAITRIKFYSNLKKDLKLHLKFRKEKILTQQALDKTIAYIFKMDEKKKAKEAKEREKLEKKEAKERAKLAKKKKKEKRLLAKNLKKDAQLISIAKKFNKWCSTNDISIDSGIIDLQNKLNSLNTDMVTIIDIK